MVNNLRFPGQYYDAETGLHYNWHRYYDPEIGRYLRADPIGLEGGINPFVYVLNDPLNSRDVRGLATYTSAEGHLVIGGGVFEVTCCTENNRKMKHLYVKVCLGAAIEASGGGGAVSNSDGKTCSSPPKNMLGGELGASFGHVGGEGSATVDVGGSGVSVAGGADVNVGPIGLKATACYYRLLNTRRVGCCD